MPKYLDNFIANIQYDHNRIIQIKLFLLQNRTYAFCLNNMQMIITIINFHYLKPLKRFSGLMFMSALLFLLSLPAFDCK